MTAGQLEAILTAAAGLLTAAAALVHSIATRRQLRGHQAAAHLTTARPPLPRRHPTAPGE